MTDPAKLPRIYHVNWFRKNPAGQFAWPGYGENSRVLKWICQRLSGQAGAVPTPIGNLPAPGALDTRGLAVSEGDLRLLLSVDPGTWQDEAALIGEHLATFGRQPARAAVGGTRRLAGAPERRPDPAGREAPVSTAARSGGNAGGEEASHHETDLQARS